MSVYRVYWETNLTGLSAGASSAPGTLTILPLSAASQSVQAFLSSTSGNYNSPPADEILQNFVDGSAIIPFASLQTNKTYYVKARSYPLADQEGQPGVYKYFMFKVPEITSDMIKQVGSSGEDTEVPDSSNINSQSIGTEVTISKSLLSISTDTNKEYTLSCAIKNTGIDVSAPVSAQTPAYYGFGTTLFFAPKNQNSKQSGGIGVFTNADSSTGYFVRIKTSESAASLGDEFKILKVKGGVIQPLPDNQSLTTNKNVGAQVGIISGTSYRLDVKLKVFPNKTIITAYINGFRVIATDTSTSNNPTLSRTPTISLFANLGTIYFDYVYAMPLTEAKYNSLGTDEVYNRGMSGTTDLAYGELFVSGLTAQEANSSGRYFEEFGPIAREIRYIRKRYERSPSYPKFTFQNLNKGVNVLASKLSSFDAELYLLNASGVSTAVSSSSGSQISVVGNNLVKSDQIVYVDEDTDKFGVQEPITFESYWIQKISDAKNLSDFIKQQWSKNQRIVTLSVFGNPLISVSDVISVKYDYHGLAGTEKFIVTDVTQSWDGGLSTTITARSIYS